jgi:hypothetical protein
MPGKVTIDLAPLWQREVRLAGTYAYGTESVPAGVGGGGGGATSAAGTTRGKKGAAQPEAVPTFQLAFEVVAAQSTGRLVSATYPLTRFEEAVAHAGSAGRRGAVKIAFDITKGHTR